MYLLGQHIFTNMSSSVLRKYHFSAGQQREQSAFGGWVWDAWPELLSCRLCPASTCYS